MLHFSTHRRALALCRVVRVTSAPSCQETTCSVRESHYGTERLQGTRGWSGAMLPPPGMRPRTTRVAPAVVPRVGCWGGAPEEPRAIPPGDPGQREGAEVADGQEPCTDRHGPPMVTGVRALGPRAARVSTHRSAVVWHEVAACRSGAGPDTGTPGALDSGDFSV